MHIVNRTGRREHEVALLIVGLIAGGGGLLAAGKLTSPVLASLGSGWPTLFFACTFASSCLALVGIFVPLKGVKGLLIEASGLWLQSSAWLFYGLVVVAKLGTDGFIFGVTVCGFALAHIIRAVRIPKEAKAVATVAVAAGIVDPVEEA